MEDLINRKSLQDLIKSTFLEMRPKLEDELTGRTIKLDEFRKKYCGGKSPEWVRTFIFVVNFARKLTTKREAGVLIHVKTLMDVTQLYLKTLQLNG